MSLEMKIDALTAAVTALTAVLAAQRPAQVATVAPAPVAAPVPAPAPVVPPPVAAPVAMPAPPVFNAAAAAVAPAPVAAPFTDQKSLITYVMSAYSALGPQKGAQIQTVLTGLGCTNINDVKPEQYGALFAGVEALKAG